MLQNVQSVTTFPLPPSKIPDFIGTTENAEKNGKRGKDAETTRKQHGKERKITETTEKSSRRR